jgi:hypothetical protein
MRSLKILVAVMGVMLVVGVAVLVAAIAGRLSRPAVAPARTFDAAPIAIPRAARIEAMTMAGPDRLILGLALPDGSRRLLVLDLAAGRQIGTIELPAAP